MIPERKYIEAIFVKAVVYLVLTIVAIFVLEIVDASNPLDGFVKMYMQSHVRGYTYLLVYVCSVFSLVILVDVDSKWIKICGWTIYFLLLSLNYTYIALNGHPIGFSDINIALQEMHFASNAISSYKDGIFYACVKSFFVVSILYYLIYSIKKIPIIRKYRLNYSLIHVAFVSFVFFSVFFITYKTECKYPNFPILYRLPATVYFCANSQVYMGERDMIFI